MHFPRIMSPLSVVLYVPLSAVCKRLSLPLGARENRLPVSLLLSLLFGEGGDRLPDVESDRKFREADAISDQCACVYLSGYVHRVMAKCDTTTSKYNKKRTCKYRNQPKLIFVYTGVYKCEEI